MTGPLNALISLNEKVLDLDMVQSWINEARLVNPRNPTMQSALDKHQDTLDQKRAMIELVMLDIASRN